MSPDIERELLERTIRLEEQVVGMREDLKAVIEIDHRTTVLEHGYTRIKTLFTVFATVLTSSFGTALAYFLNK